MAKVDYLSATDQAHAKEMQKTLLSQGIPSKIKKVSDKTYPYRVYPVSDGEELKGKIEEEKQKQTARMAGKREAEQEFGMSSLQIFKGTTKENKKMADAIAREMQREGFDTKVIPMRTGTKVSYNIETYYKHTGAEARAFTPDRTREILEHIGQQEVEEKEKRKISGYKEILKAEDKRAKETLMKNLTPTSMYKRSATNTVEFLQKDIQKPLKTTGEHIAGEERGIVGSQTRQIKSLTSGRHPKMYEENEGRIRKITVEPDLMPIASPSQSRLGEEQKPKKNIAGLPTSKLDFSSGI